MSDKPRTIARGRHGTAEVDPRTRQKTTIKPVKVKKKKAKARPEPDHTPPEAA